MLGDKHWNVRFVSLHIIIFYFQEKILQSTGFDFCKLSYSGDVVSKEAGHEINAGPLARG